MLRYPKAFEAEYGGDKVAYDTASLKLNQVDSYLELGRELQRAYGTHIDISLGFEVDISLVLKAISKTSLIAMVH